MQTTLINLFAPPPAQVKKAGALDASSVESEAEQAEVARIRKPVKIAVAVVFFLAMIVWPLLTLPAGVFRCPGGELCTLHALNRCLGTQNSTIQPFVAACSLGYFKFYVVLAFIFLLIATVIGTLLPLWEARDLFTKVRFCGFATCMAAWQHPALACTARLTCHHHGTRSSSRGRPSRSSSRPASTAPGAAAPGESAVPRAEGPVRFLITTLTHPVPPARCCC